MGVWNDDRFLRESIESIVSQTLRDLELIIVDDGSTDNSRNIIERFAGADERVRVIANSMNQGLAWALNCGLEAASGRYIARHDADDIALPWRLQVQTEFLDRHPEYFLVGGCALEIDHKGRELGIRPRPIGEKNVLRDLLRKGVQPIVHPSFMFRSGTGLVYRKKFVYSQDYDFLLNAASRNLRLFNLPQILLKYRVSKESKQIPKAVRQFLYRQIALTFYHERMANGRVDSYASYDFTPIEQLDLDACREATVASEVFRLQFAVDAPGHQIRPYWRDADVAFRRSNAARLNFLLTFLAPGVRRRLRVLKHWYLKSKVSEAKGPTVALLLSTGNGLATWKKIGTLQRETAIWRSLAQRGWRVSLYTYDTERHPEPALGLPVYPGPPFRIPGPLLPVYSWLRPWLDHRSGKTHAVLVTNQAHSGWPAIFMARAWKAKVIARCGYVLGRNGAAGLSARKLQRRVCWESWTHQKAHLSIVPTEELKQWCEKNFDLSAERIRIIPNFVDTSVFKPDPSSTKDIDVLCVGRLSAEKRNDLLLTALAGQLGLRVVFIGQGPQREQLEVLAKEQRVTLDCVAQVQNSELPTYYNRTKVFVLCSAWEGHPKCLLEAMACGCACVGTDTPGIQNMISDGTNGRLVPSNPEALRNAIFELLDDPIRRAELGRAAMVKAAKDFGFTRVLAAYEEALISVFTEE